LRCESLVETYEKSLASRTTQQKEKGSRLAPLFCFWAVRATNPALLGFLTRGFSVIVMPVMMTLASVLAMVPVMRRGGIGALGGRGLQSRPRRRQGLRCSS